MVVNSAQISLLIFFLIVNEKSLLMRNVMRQAFIWWLWYGSLPCLFITVLNERQLPITCAWNSVFLLSWQFFKFKMHNICLAFMVLHRYNVQILAVTIFYCGVFSFFFFFNLLINLQTEFCNFFIVFFNPWRR